MKRILAVLFVLLLCGTTASWAQTSFRYNGLKYTVTDGNNVSVAKGSSFLQVADIPAKVTHNGVEYIVTSIVKYAFEDCTQLTSVTIPETVTSIGEWAFINCTGLTSLTIPNSVTSIENGAFSRIKNVVYSGSLSSPDNWGARTLNGTIDGDFIYSNSEKTNLTAYIGSDSEITIPNTVTSIGGFTFYKCTGLTSVIIPDGFTSIDDYVFYKCTDLTSITIPNSVTSIGNWTFCDCISLTTITISNSVTSIGNSAFSGCTGLTSVTIPQSVTSIGSSAFSGCTGLTSVAIPNSVTSIGSSAFEDCTQLTSVTIPNSVTTIHSSAFHNCNNLTIYCQAESKPEGWVTSINNWNSSNCSVEWNTQMFTVTLATNNSTWGTITGSGCYIVNYQTTITARPSIGYHFVKWSDDNTDNPRTIIISEDIALSAVFEADEIQGGNEQGGENGNGNENQGGNNEGENENQGGNENNPGTAVAENAANAIGIYTYDRTIVVENPTDEIHVYDAMGNLICRNAINCVRTEIPVNNTGVYIVKTGNVVKRVMVN